MADEQVSVTIVLRTEPREYIHCTMIAADRDRLVNNAYSAQKAGVFDVEIEGIPRKLFVRFADVLYIF